MPTNDLMQELAQVPVELLGSIALQEHVDEESVRYSLGEAYGHLAPIVAKILAGEQTSFAQPENGNAMIMDAEFVDVADEPINASQGQEQHSTLHAKNPFDAPASEASPFDATNPAENPVSATPFDIQEEIRKLREQQLKSMTINEDDFVSLNASDFVGYTFSQPELNDTSGLTAERELPQIEADTSEVSESVATPADSSHRGTVLLTWPKKSFPQENYTLFRVIASDYEMHPLSPESGEQLVVTQGRAFRDKNLGESAMRHYAVWAHSAPLASGLTGVLMSQPVLVGEQVVVFPPENVQITESAGTIQGSWELLDGHTGVTIYAKPENRHKPLINPENALSSGIDRQGFVYDIKDPGHPIEFQIFGKVEFRGTTVREEIGSPVVKIQTRAEVEQVKLITYEITGENQDEILLVWEAPSNGKVMTCLSATPPGPELHLQMVDKRWIDADEAIKSGTKTFEEVTTPRETVIQNLKWPEYHEVYITLVNIIGDSAWATKPAVLQRVEDITQHRLIERVNSQLITFDWPQGAAFVTIERDGQGPQQLMREDYQRQGGVRLKLTHTGEKDIKFTPTAIYEGKVTRAQNPRVISYPGLKRYSYFITYRNGTWHLYIWRIGFEDRNPPEFRLVHNQKRFPLFPGDGQPLRVAARGGQTFDQVIQPQYLPPGEPNSTPENSSWMIESTFPPTGFFRLFVVENEADEGRARQVVLETGNPLYIHVNRGQ
ncbi:hypothetical protein QP027_11085 [Corynebacterium breve]|uniref:Fibronectin type III domain-containing protein n=1 Tax=Corynebacterium breve TaxID=3049799 RepID=A0ABY8VG45_9CORY|nr:hypothetical protein [Corynebacterium breve]WIM67613.1 hypothetical protein QP027_11085 [Corynebacterium breve]